MNTQQPNLKEQKRPENIRVINFIPDEAKLKIARTKNRADIISYIYKFQLLNEEISIIDAFENGELNDKQIKVVETIIKNFETLKKLIVTATKGWTWLRISPIIRSILLLGALEMKIKDKPIVIQEMVILTQILSPDNSYKFVNATLERIGAFYEKNKK